MYSLGSKFKNSTSGSTLIEFSFLFPILLAMTFGMVEFGYVLHQFNNAQKATQAGARIASTQEVLLGADDCFESDPEDADGNDITNAGTSCADVTNKNSWNVTCYGTTATADCKEEGLTAILNEMQIYYPEMKAANLEVEFGPTDLGYIGRGRPVPSITVKAVNITYNYVAIGAVLKFFDGGLPAAVSIDQAQTTIIGEDMKDGA